MSRNAYPTQIVDGWASDPSAGHAPRSHLSELQVKIDIERETAFAAGRLIVQDATTGQTSIASTYFSPSRAVAVPFRRDDGSSGYDLVAVKPATDPIQISELVLA